MDNVTHALAGMLVAEAVCVVRREARQSVRAAAYLVSALANNLPDVDVFYASFLTPRPLGNLLHHRGYTHTLLVALPCAWLLGALMFRWFRRRNPDAAARERRLFVGLSLAGVVLHLCLDFGNNYGIHPFWPLSGRWFYGDAVFILEPLWWAIAIPIVARPLRRRWLKVTLGVLLSAVLVVCWFVPFVSLTSRFTLLGVTALSTWLAARGSERQRVAFALTASLAVPGVFACASLNAKAELRAATQAAFPALEVLDIAVSPLPVNPTCWEGLVAGEQGGNYRVLRATVAVGHQGAVACAAGMDAEPTAPVTRVSRANHGGVRWLTQYETSVATLARLRRDDCRFRSLLVYARLPYLAASAQMAGDLRYDRTRGADFSDVALPNAPRKEGCPSLVPTWREPRADLFEP